jgi:deoxyribodipyrimidine photo-lyase
VTSILWLRRDLRLHDLPALHAALRHDEVVVPFFCFDDRLLHGRHASEARTQFLLETLAELDAGLRERGSGLVLRHGEPVQELLRLARDVDARTVHASVDAGPLARRRDRAAADRLAAAGVGLHGHPGLFVIDDLAAIATSAGRPYSVFTPFHRAWLRRPRRPVLRAPRRLPALPRDLDPGRLPTLGDLGLEQPLSAPAPGGESAGRAAMERFLRRPGERYADGRNDLGHESVSRLSPYLHLGSVSARELESRLGDTTDEYRRQLCWRDFYAHVLRHFPENAHREHQPRYRGRIGWSEDREALTAWREGATGFPLVDAAMRQLNAEGWMHNRARLVAASFLVKDLGIDWRWGERHFMRLLLDGDEASNNGNWQWVASVGVDPAPVSRRLFNPARQQRRFDPDGRYVRRHVPELARVPDEHLAEPWRMSEALQAECGCVIGRDYPPPIVDHAQARRAALARYGSAG